MGFTVASLDAWQQEHLSAIDDFVMDCLVSDNHSFDAEVTEFPVESGSTISDNIRAKPVSIMIEAIISNTPLAFASSKRADGSIPADAAYKLLLDIRRERRLVTLTTSLDIYDRMALESLSIPRASGRGDALRFTATFKQVELVVNNRDKRVAIPIAQAPTAVSTFTPIQQFSDKYAYVNASNGSWYDDAISAWRESTKYNHAPPPGSAAALIQVVEGHWILTRSRPLLIPVATWRRETISQHTVAALRPRMITLQGGTALPFLRGQLFSAIIMLQPKNYMIRSLLGSDGNIA